MQQTDSSNGSSHVSTSTGVLTKLTSSPEEKRYEISPESSEYVKRSSSLIIEEIANDKRNSYISYSALNHIKSILDNALNQLDNAIQDDDDDLNRENFIASFADSIHQLVQYIDIDQNFQDMVFYFITVIELNFAEKLTSLQVKTLREVIGNFRKNVFPTEQQIMNSISSLEKHKLYFTF